MSRKRCPHTRDNSEASKPTYSRLLRTKPNRPTQACQAFAGDTQNTGKRTLAGVLSSLATRAAAEAAASSTPARGGVWGALPL